MKKFKELTPDELDTARENIFNSQLRMIMDNGREYYQTAYPEVSDEIYYTLKKTERIEARIFPKVLIPQAQYLMENKNIVNAIKAGVQNILEHKDTYFVDVYDIVVNLY